jgi:hypothetical protein
MRNLPRNICRGERGTSSVPSLVAAEAPAPGSAKRRPIFGLLVLAALLSLLTPARAGDPIFRTLSFAWDASPSGDVVGYRIHIGTRSGQYSRVVDVGNLTRADVPNLVDGTTYYFTITAYSASGQESLPSDEYTHTVNPSTLLNVSARGLVQDGDNAVMAGFTIGGSTRKRVIIRALGPSLKDAGVKKPLADPTLELRGPSGSLISNNNWRDGDRDALAATSLAPKSDKDAAVIVSLDPGNYTAIVRSSKKKVTGIAVLEVYDAGIAPR